MTLPPTPAAGVPGSALLLSTVVGHAVSIADRAAIADIESHCPVFYRMPDGRKVYDTRPMTDEREHAPEVVDMARQALDYARWRQLIWSPPGSAHLVVLAVHS